MIPFMKMKIFLHTFGQLFNNCSSENEVKRLTQSFEEVSDKRQYPNERKVKSYDQIIRSDHHVEIELDNVQGLSQCLDGAAIILYVETKNE